MSANTATISNGTRDWSALGLAWEQATVSKQAGDSRTDRVAYNTKAELPKVIDFDKFVAAFGAEKVLGFVNASNSLRVGAQAVCRAMLEENASAKPEAMREAVYNWMNGVRSRTTSTIVITKRYLPNMQEFTGTDETEFRQECVAALVEMGVAVEKAIEKANEAKW